jgi:hypothetical protein
MITRESPLGHENDTNGIDPEIVRINVLRRDDPVKTKSAILGHKKDQQFYN